MKRGTAQRGPMADEWTVRKRIMMDAQMMQDGNYFTVGEEPRNSYPCCGAIQKRLRTSRVLGGYIRYSAHVRPTSEHTHRIPGLRTF